MTIILNKCYDAFTNLVIICKWPTGSLAVTGQAIPVHNGKNHEPEQLLRWAVVLSMVLFVVMFSSGMQRRPMQRPE